MSSNNTEQSPVEKKDLSFSMAKANLYSLLFIIPAILLILIYFVIWGNTPLKSLENISLIKFYLYLILVFVVGTVLHELIHALSWVYFGKKSFLMIKIGFQWKTLTPYAHCTEPMEVNAYRLGGAMPGLLVGVLPYLMGLISENVWIMLFGVLFIIGAGGDILILWSIRNVKSGQLVEDHPTRAGCYVIETQNKK